MNQNFLKTFKKLARSPPEDGRHSIAAKIHEMRQPLQVMSLLHGVLAERVKDEEAHKMILRLEETLVSLSQILESMSLKTGTHTIIYNRSSKLQGGIPHEDLRATQEPADKPDSQSLIWIVDDDLNVRESMGYFLSSSGYKAALYESCEHFLEACTPDNSGCLLVDAMLPGMSGLDLLRHLKENNYRVLPIMITGHKDVSLAVQAMKAGAADFVEKPVKPDALLIAVEKVLKKAQNASSSFADREAALIKLAHLSVREKEIMHLIFAGHQSKNIAADLGISRRTVETHRANIMKKTGVRTLSELLKLALAAGL